MLARPERRMARETGIAVLQEQVALVKNEKSDPAELATPLGSTAEMDPYQGSALTDYCLAMFNLSEMIYLD